MWNYRIKKIIRKKLKFKSNKMTYIRNLGKGTYGTVDLYEDKKDGKKYAVKTSQISMKTEFDLLSQFYKS